MYTYTVEHLKEKTFSELKLIARDMALVPLGDRRCRQNWIDALVGVELPLLQLLEVSPGVSIDAVENLPVADRPFEPIEPSKFGRIVYPRPAQNLIEAEAKVSQSAIAQMVKIFPSVSESDRLLESIEEAAKISPAALEGDRFSPPIEEAAKTFPGVTFSPRFLACYSSPQTESIHYQSDADGQLSLLDFEVESVDEPPDPDDFESLNAFREAVSLWDAQHPEPLEISLDSFSEWAPCPDDWYEPASSEVLELSSAILSEGCANESSSICKFLIPVFDAWCDRTNRNDESPTVGVGARLPLPKPPSFPSLMIVAVGDSVVERKNFSGFELDSVVERKNFFGFEFDCVAEWKNFSGFMFGAVGDRTNGNDDEPPTAGVGALLPKPKPPSFPSMGIVAGDRSSIKKFARSVTLLSGRAPPGGDASF